MQKEKSLPGLFKEVKDDLDKIGVDDLKSVSKNVWKKRVKEYVNDKQRSELLDDMKRYKKLDQDELANEKFERKEYFDKLDLDNVRMDRKISRK